MVAMRELRARFSADANSFTRELRNMNTELRNVGTNSQQATGHANSGFSNFKSTLLGFGSAYLGFEAIKGSVTGLAGAMIGGNAEMETYQNTLTTVLKSSDKAKETLDWATQFAASTPFEIPDIVEATTKLSIYGINAKETLGSIGDMAAVMGKPLDQAIEAIADAQTGELERLKEFGITKKQLADKAQQLYGKELVNAKGQITDQKLLNKTLFALMDERYKGGMDRQAKTFAGTMSNIQDALGTMTRVLGEGLFNRVKSLATKVAPVLSSITAYIKGDFAGSWLTLSKAFGSDKANQITGVFERIRNAIKGTIEWFKSWKPSIDNVKTAFSNLASVFAPVFEPIAKFVGGAIALLVKNLPIIVEKMTGWVAKMTSLSQYGPSILYIVTAIGSYLLTVKAIAIAQAIWNNALKIGAVAMRLFNLVMSLNPIGIVVALIITLAVAFVTAYKKSETFRNIVNGVWASLKSAFSATVKWFTTTLPKWWNDMISKAKSLGSKLKSTFTSVWDGIKSSVMGRINNIKSTITGIWDTASSIAGKIKSAWSGLFKGIALPHFKLHGSLNPKTWIKGGLPSLSVDWYAKGGIFAPNSPRVIGIGDAKVPEAAIPLSDKVLGKIGQAIGGTMGGSVDMIQVGRMLDKALQRPVVLQIDGREFARTTAKNVQDELDMLSARNGRMGGSFS